MERGVDTPACGQRYILWAMLPLFDLLLSAWSPWLSCVISRRLLRQTPFREHQLRVRRGSVAVGITYLLWSSNGEECAAGCLYPPMEASYLCLSYRFLGICTWSPPSSTMKTRPLSVYWPRGVFFCLIKTVTPDLT